MKINNILLSIFILITPYVGLAQKNKKKVNYKKISTQQIEQLHHGGLLVRLTTKKNSIDTLRKTGQNKQANKIEKQQIVLNKTIIKAFKENFNFCPVYFFFSDYAPFVSEKQFEKVIFLNDSLLQDTTIKFNLPNFLTAEFGTIEQDTSQYSESNIYYEHGDNGLEKHTLYFGDSNMGFNALIIKNDKFYQLNHPFPFYVRTFESLPFEQNAHSVVKKLNKKLHSFYNKNKIN